MGFFNETPKNPEKKNSFGDILKKGLLYITGGIIVMIGLNKVLHAGQINREP
jgi:hypothetical protein